MLAGAAASGIGSLAGSAASRWQQSDEWFDDPKCGPKFTTGAVVFVCRWKCRSGAKLARLVPKVRVPAPRRITRKIPATTRQQRVLSVTHSWQEFLNEHIKFRTTDVRNTTSRHGVLAEVGKDCL